MEVDDEPEMAHSERAIDVNPLEFRLLQERITLAVVAGFFLQFLFAPQQPA